MATEQNACPHARQSLPADAPFAHAPAPPPPAIPDHQLLRRIGRGSYGEVWLARNLMGMYRAVKIVYRASFADQRPFERELSGIRSFEPLSRSHEGFVDILHLGRDEGQGCFYYVMELADDELTGQEINPDRYSPKTLAKEVSRHGKLCVHDCVQLGLALSQALAELHKHGLVHRDIKPSNIIFVHGVPKLADIGLVAEVQEARSYVGTEGFIPPEGPGTPQADVYSLGKVLYEACTGKDRQDFPELPTQWHEFPELEQLLELNEIILQACKNDIAKRYPSAWELHADLVVMANGKSVRRLRTLERRLARLKRVAGIATLVLALLGLISYQFYREWRRASQFRQQQVGANVAYGNRAMESGDLLGALPYFANALRLDQGAGSLETTHRLRLGSVLAHCPKVTHMWFAHTWLNDGQFSPDGKRVLLAQYFGKAAIYDLQTQTLYAHPFGQVEGLASASYSPDGRWIVTASENGTACVWDAVSLNKLLHLVHPDRVYNARFSPDGLRLVTSCKDGSARVWDARTGRLELTLKQHTGPVAFAAFSPDGQLIVTASRDASARIWRSKDGAPLGPPLKHATWVTYACFSPDSQAVLTACEDHKVRLWDVATARRIGPDLPHRDIIRSAEFSPDGRLLVTAAYDRTVRLWLARNLQPLASNPVLRHGERVTHASFCPDGHRLLTTCIDGSARIWDLAGSTMPPLPVQRSYSQDASRFLTFTNSTFQVWDAATDEPVSAPAHPGPGTEKVELSPNGRFVLSIGLAQTNATATNHLVQVCDAATGNAIGPALLLSKPLTGASLSGDGLHLATFGGRVAELWDVRAGKTLSPPLMHAKAVEAAAFSPDNHRVLTWSGSLVHVWDAAHAGAPFPPLKHPQPVAYADFSPDGSLLVTCCSDYLLTKCFAQLWKSATGQPVGPQLPHADGVLRAAFSPDNRRLVTSSEDFTARVWDVATGRQVATSLQHEHQVQAAAFSPDARWLATASSDKTARIWSAGTGDPLTPPLRHLARLTDVKFLPGGRRIVTADGLGHAWIWELPVDQRPIEDLVLLGQFLSGNTLDSAGHWAAPQDQSVEALWQRLHTRYPSDFAATTKETIAWHELAADESELEQEWFAAAFHLERLLALQPGLLSLQQRLAQAKLHLKNQN